ncbi:MAG: maltose alpha-D-glucosyltransferase [Nitrospirota bacterium]|nr:maltose alpha-D-glucosyltransferase [Nitrospirota bacterium]
MPGRNGYPVEDPLWYKDAVIYQLHIKTFFDSNDDGLGDFQGLIRKLGYLEDLGVTAIWLLPFYPSPLKDDGYDIADYFSINPDYGRLKDFRAFLRAAHDRGLRVITELVLNHTSDQHPWFQRARRAKPGSPWRDFYVWSDTPEKYRDARIIFVDFESSNWAWDPVANAYYWHRFYSHQPDLNFENPHVQKAVFQAIDFWFEMGVDGLRLDAVPYLYEKEGTNCENLPETHLFLKKLRAHIDRKFRDKMLLAEANQWPEDAVAYFGGGDECHMAFHFPVMPRIFMGLQMEDRFPVVDILDQTPRIAESCQWAMFLRNHDELTLEMVTDEERDYMYKVYARDPKARINLGIRRRLASLTGNNRRKIELLNLILFSLPGTPIIYYGDEIGMGDNYYLGDRNGVRTPMQWSSDKNAGFSRANPQKLYLPIIIDPEYHYEAVNVENQDSNPSSLLWWMKRVIAMRKQLRAFGRGGIEFVASDNAKVLAFTRQYEEETVLVVINLSRFPQVVELDLSKYQGATPEEVFGQNIFPVIRDAPYVLTLGFYDYFWFLLRKEEEPFGGRDFLRLVPQLRVNKSWENVLRGKMKEKLEDDVLPSYIKGCRWFGGKARKIQDVTITEDIPLDKGESSGRLIFVKVRYLEGEADSYLLPVAFSSGEEADRIISQHPNVIIAALRIGESEGILHDGVYSEEFRKRLLLMISRRGTAKGLKGQLHAYPGRLLKRFKEKALLFDKTQVLQAEQTNTSILYGNELFLKLYRHIEEGLNPDPEIVRFLSEEKGFSNIPPFAGVMEYLRQGAASVIIGHLQGFVPNQGDAWNFTLDAIGQYFERVLSGGAGVKDIPPCPPSLAGITFQDIPPLLQELIGGYYLEMISTLGKRTGELHLALSRPTEDPNFAPEPYTMLYQRSVYQSMRNLTMRVVQLLRGVVKKMPEELRAEASEILAAEQDILKSFQKILEGKISAVKIRYHGDYHLGQVLFTGNDFVIIDFEGEPARTLSERRLKRSPIRDVAGMIRSFHYAAYNSLLKQTSVRAEDISLLERWSDIWYCYVSGIFLSSYMQTVQNAPFIPLEQKETEILLESFLLEKAVYELGYELNNRPDWVIIPIRGIKRILQIN